MKTTTHEIALGSPTQQPITFECTNGKEVMARLMSDFERIGADIVTCDDYGFCAVLNGQSVSYTMADIN